MTVANDPIEYAPHGRRRGGRSGGGLFAVLAWAAALSCANRSMPARPRKPVTTPHMVDTQKIRIGKTHDKSNQDQSDRRSVRHAAGKL